ncbi:fimbrial biogenesis chaperone [Pseudomonas protegens]|uniref:fimbrial biogenesis chaperone n=1 Tax=Pseudomonas protegens TaxID=380021 RepID=UPI001B314D74|nr:fimbria/pilus periplasmic chaperone [Pseudomonas protegens]MBP5100147.1 fimbria/pilus periplasmic chaperone [Pseudomonas protegens]MBP5103847.1 fimbria/pilus periplasmic chaperone [Pseudomonas protegens]MBP5114476.1 fimbria/pilus periplasmic chaperone [Pseudomonas protegens]MBP5130492.1 fimbria/pilus periplasmic chaperone [Pseudomonas protegens]MBP5146119.1 fimbria/pilus periplasmic chaperone [Pseudomonas protegens]
MTPTARFVHSLVIGVMFLGILSGVAHAGIVLEGTRLVYPAEAREVTLKLSNTGSVALLAQSWIDEGDANKSPEEIKVPFLLAPAVSRVEAGGSAILRVSYSKEPLAKDRESLFWLNVLETPPRRKQDENVLQFAFRTRIKIFFRPENLIGNAGMAGEKLKWELGRKGASQVSVIKVFNPTPYYVSFGRMEVAVSGRRIDLKPGMVAPFGYESFPWPASAPSQPTKASIEYEVIDDFGGRGLLKKSLL